MESLPPQTATPQDDDVRSPIQHAPIDAPVYTNMTEHSTIGHEAGQPIPAAYQGVPFQSTTIAPSPPARTPKNAKTEPRHLADITTLLTSSASAHDAKTPMRTPISAGLRVQTDVGSASLTPSTDPHSNSARRLGDNTARSSNNMGVIPTRTPSIKSIAASIIASAPSSAFSSPMLSAMPDVTPLPSPLMSNDSPGPWHKFTSRPTSKDYVLPAAAESTLLSPSGESLSTAIMNNTKRRAYQGLVSNSSELNNEKKVGAQGRNRSVSEYVPDPIQAPRYRPQTVSGSHAAIPESTPTCVSPTETSMRRERHLAVERGITPVTQQASKIPTPPASRTGADSSDSDSAQPNTIPRSKRPRYDYFEAYTIGDEKRRRWRALKVLGQGTFSKVMLATSQPPDEADRMDEDHVMDGVGAPVLSKLDRKKLVAIKICEHGPKGGGSEERIEMSLKRELEIMKSISHPCLIRLKAFNIEETRAILVLSYCAGGDLFEVASEQHDLLVPSLLRRIVAELVGALQYLHERHIVHRDIKLENVLVNLPRNELAKPTDWSTYPYPVVTLTDLGLSRRVADDEKLTTRCGSDDYAAPEVIMGQPYDGRAVDAWSFGVLLYALLESRLPFDPPPGMSEHHKQRSRTSHRIARIEWCWVKYAGEDGDHEADLAKFSAAGLTGAMEVVEGLLKRARSRWTIAQVAEQQWVKEAVAVEGGVKFREEVNPEEVSS